jgi:hypothetical protein
MFGDRRQRGTTIAELLVVSLIFSLILGVCMYATVSGFRMFEQAGSRHQLQREAAAIFAWLQRDLEVTNLVRCVTESRTSGIDNRDKLGIVGLGSWQEPIAKDALGHPDWDKVIIYSATRDPEAGQLVRQSIDAPGGVTADTVRTFMVDGAALGADLRRLAGGVKIFRTVKAVEEESLLIDLVLVQNTVQTGTAGTRKEVFEVQTSVRPRNTFPKF